MCEWQPRGSGATELAVLAWPPRCASQSSSFCSGVDCTTMAAANTHRSPTRRTCLGGIEMHARKTQLRAGGLIRVARRSSIKIQMRWLDCK